MATLVDKAYMNNSGYRLTQERLKELGFERVVHKNYDDYESTLIDNADRIEFEIFVK
jgi:hypothetical protein